MTKEWIDEYYRRLLPHYAAMSKNEIVRQINNDWDLSFFCTQWGEAFPADKSKGLLFVGRATNGWGGGIEVENLLSECIFNSPEQMKWVDDCWSNHRDKDGRKLWSGNRSPFWRVIRSVTERYHNTDWYKHIAWSNLCKCSFSGEGNPTNKLWYAIVDHFKEIMKIDIAMLRPKAVIMITGGWENEFIGSLVGDTPCLTLPFHGASVRAWKTSDTLFVASVRPEGRAETPIVDCICNAIDTLS